MTRGAPGRPFHLRSPITDHGGRPSTSARLKAIALERGSEYARRTECGKTARSGPYGGRRVTGVPTVDPIRFPIRFRVNGHG